MATPEATPIPLTAKPLVSVVIPVYNGAGNMETVLQAVYASTFGDFEAVLVNDGSTDDTLEVLDGLRERYPHRLIDLRENRGVSKARNAGAEAARGEILVFIDADCVVQPRTMENCVEALRRGDGICVGGAYTVEPWDKGFFNEFQSIYIHYVETKVEHPDYIATHCMAIPRSTFLEFGGFITDSFIGHAASVEDVELSHRLLEAGHTLIRPKNILVQHMFGYNFRKSVKNAIKKSKYWTMYSLKNRDVTKDSGAASYELKANVGTQVLNLGLGLAALVTGKLWFLLPMAGLLAINVIVNSRLLLLMQREKGWLFLAKAMAYYIMVYPFVVAYGSGLGTLKYLWEVKLLHKYS